MILQVLGQLLDFGGQDSNLNFGRTGIVLMRLEFRNYLILLFLT